MDNEPLKGWRARQVRNPYHDAGAACRAWCNGQLWGNPLHLAEQTIHVYGIYRRNWSQVFVDFRRDWITIVKPASIAASLTGIALELNPNPDDWRKIIDEPYE